jgi:hypothetical protein
MLPPLHGLEYISGYRIDGEVLIFPRSNRAISLFFWALIVVYPNFGGTYCHQLQCKPTYHEEGDFVYIRKFDIHISLTFYKPEDQNINIH